MCIWFVLGRIVGLVAPLRLAAPPFLEEACSEFAVGVWEVELWAAVVLAVADVLKGIRNRGFTHARWEALHRFWAAVCRHGPCGPLWMGGPPRLHGSYKWVFDSMDILNDFTEQVVVSRREIGIRKWTRWLRGARPYAWLRPDFVLPSPFLVIKDPLTEASRILVEPHLIDAEFRKAWMPFFL